ncbi:hypothetical protein BWZ29_20780 [Enterobacter cancerogenus]|jgi:hypothetical protein|uniref:hypothetical protein n=1 Tax=Enterobacter cloacae complex TaxID=354276 RepID=UPI0009B20703|nr:MULTISPECIES: hypothetical protein [Enterobacter cloacae complex]MCK6787155.1 hypothetical protein [Enterobacter roggenkampii]MCM7834711.1 hypothetical protein [Enterobacter asburiae]OQD47506.1 hypothetical protein BWZ29_20780 [Enterobacter cancerogenus]
MSEQLVNLETLERDELLAILDKYLIAYELDSDGDIFLETPARLYLEINKDKGVFRMYSFIHYKDYQDSTLIPQFVTKFNNGSYTMSYTTISDKSILCEYRLYLLGGMNESGIIKSIRKAESEVIQMKEVLLYTKQLLEE